MIKSQISLLLVTFCMGIAACSSKSSESREKLDSCEQVKEYDEIYQTCIEDAKKIR